MGYLATRHADIYRWQPWILSHHYSTQCPHKLSELFNCTSTEVFTLKQAQSIALQSAGTNKIGKTVRLYVNYSTINILSY